jgi:hypothetical protein
MRASRGIGEERPISALDEAERLAVIVDNEWQPAAQLG